LLYRLLPQICRRGWVFFELALLHTFPGKLEYTSTAYDGENYAYGYYD